MLNKLFFFIISIFISFSPLAIAGADDEVGEPVMTPGLNAYVYELGEKKYKAMFNTGIMHASFQTKAQNYLIMGGSFYLSELSIFETGFYANFSLGGRNENIITSGVDVRLHLVPVTYMEILYIKCGLGYSRFHSGNIIGRGLEVPFGIGMEIATGQSTVINVEYVRRPIFFTTGPSVWNIMLSVGYAW